MVYKLLKYKSLPIFYVDQATYDANPEYESGELIVGTQEDAATMLLNLQEDLLNHEAANFVVCVEATENNHTILRVVQDSDPEDIVCYVPDFLNHTNIQVFGKSQAIALNTQKKQEFLKLHNLDSFVEIESLPFKQTYAPEIYGVTTGTIPVEVM